MIQSNVSFHIGLAAEREMNKSIIKKIPVHLLLNTWLGLIHYYISNNDIFSSNGSVLKEYSSELMNNYYNLIKI